MMTRVHNFSAGPAALPLPVLERIRDEIPEWNGAGMSVGKRTRGPALRVVSFASRGR